MTDIDESRRMFLKSALAASTFTAPAILSIHKVQEVAAVSPAPTNPTLTVTATGTNQYTITGSGFDPSMAYVLIVFPSGYVNGSSDFVLTAILTDGAGSFSYLHGYPPNWTAHLGVYPGRTNGGVMFLTGAFAL